MESDGDKFKRLAEKRVNKLVKTLELIGNLSNQTNYHYEWDEVEQIFKYINRSVEECYSKFKAVAGVKARKQFTLKKRPRDNKGKA